MRRRGLFRNKSSLEYNTIIGNVSSTITNESDLAAKLTGGDWTVTAADILRFKIEGTDVHAFVNKPYGFVGNAFYNNSLITSYLDLGGKCVRISAQGVFRNATSLAEIYFPAADNISNFSFLECGSLIGKVTFEGVTNLTQGYWTFTNSHNITELSFPNMTAYTGQSPQNTYGGMTSLTRLHMPLCASIGSSVGDNGVLQSLPIGVEIVCSSVLATNNNGGEDGDIAYARNTKGATITYV